ncbi:MAG: GspE/PulE family protein [Candidatus Bathyarchaeia archaeon]
MSFDELLVTKYGVKEDDLRKAYQLRKEIPLSLGQILINMGAVSEEQFINALSEYLRIPIFEGPFTYDGSLIENLPDPISIEDLTRKKILPVGVDQEKKVLRLVTSNPFDYETLNFIALSTGYKIQLFLSTEEKINSYLKTLVANRDTDIVSLDVEEDADRLAELARGAPVIKYLNTILSKAVELRATDIHLEAQRGRGRVRLRIDGILHDFDQLEENFTRAVISRIKLLSSLNIAERRLPQDGKFSTRVSSIVLDVRVSTIPMIHGEGVVLRLLFRERLSFDIRSLGMENDHINVALKLISKPYGMVLVTGPTGSGKTTTLYSMITYLNSSERKIITIEDPVEYQIEGINQIQVKPEIGLTFASCLRSILRHDPDVILVGEIRDRETAEISIHSALTGHLVLSTLHTNDSPSSLFRLVEMGIERYLINAAIVGVIAQRIVRRNCQFCSEPDPNFFKNFPELDIESIRSRWPEIVTEISPAKGRGCEKCVGTGYRGRIAIFEMFEYDDELKESFLKLGSLELFRKFLYERRNFRTLREDGFIKVLKGITTPAEVFRVC